MAQKREVVDGDHAPLRSMMRAGVMKSGLWRRSNPIRATSIASDHRSKRLWGWRNATHRREAMVGDAGIRLPRRAFRTTIRSCETTWV